MMPNQSVLSSMSSPSSDDPISYYNNLNYQFHNPNQQVVAQAPIPQSPQQPQPQPNFLEKLLPTAGGILGGLAGLPLNALDAVSGVGGTALDMGLAGAGSALGKTLEDKLTHQAMSNGVLGAAAGGAIGQGIGEGVGAIGSGLFNALGSKAANVGADMIQGQAARGMLTDADAQLLQKMGITDLRQIPDIHNIVSGANGVLPSTVKDVLSDSRPVDLTGFDKTANNLVYGNPGITSDSAINQVNKVLNQTINNSIPGDVDIVPTKGNANDIFTYEHGALQNALPENVFPQVQNLQQRAAAAYKNGFDPFTHAVTNPEQAGLYKVYSGLANDLEGRVFGEGSNAIPLTDEVKQGIVDGLSPLKDVNSKAYDFYNNAIQNADNLQDLRGLQSPIVRASQAVAGSASKEGAAAGTTAMDVAKGAGAPLSLALSHPGVALGSLLLSSPSADRVGASLLSQLGEKTAQDTLANKAVNAVIAPALGGIMGNVAGNAGNTVSGPTSNTVNEIKNVGENNITTEGEGNMSPNSVLAALAAQAANNLMRTENANPFMVGDYANALNSINSMQSEVAPLQKAYQAQAALNSLNQAYQQAGGGQGPIGGTYSTILGNLGLNPSARAFLQERQAATNQIANAYGIKPEQVNAALPGLINSQAGGNELLGNLLQQTQSVGNPMSFANPSLLSQIGLNY